MKRILCLTLLLMGYATAFAQKVEMADTMRSEGKIYVVIGTIAIIFIGLAIYLFSIDRRLTRIEKQMD
ncbi:CcmD family protein [Mucilaginibacter terrae]|uniref:CcmD family protein n=1 Tax=Mucilaginibacter terrae TaxID=1955052 RepID=A0ABU3H0V4_9SPHI|nr:CcmD family protein [Mucilaginibacter terrae]MDT3405649.1 CcmD family protein [Mucilaginibacter terrae]